MPAYRTVSPTRGAAWITDGLLALRRTPGPFLLACALVALLRSLPVLGVLLGLLMPVFYAGLVSLLHARAAGDAGRSAQAYDGFLQPGAFARLLPIVSFNLAFVLGAAAVLVFAAGPSFEPVLATARTGAEPDRAQVAALLADLALPALMLVPIGLYVAWMQMLAIPRAMLDGVPGAVALRDAAAATWVNLGAFVVNLACLAALLFALAMAAAMAMLLLSAVVAAVPALALVVQWTVLILLTAAFHAIHASVMFRATREVFDAPAAGPPPRVDVIEA